MPRLAKNIAWMTTDDLSGQALDIGGSWARLYSLASGRVTDCQRLELLGTPQDRVAAIANLVRNGPPRIPTACAGRKDPENSEVTLSFFGTPLPRLCLHVLEETGVEIGPLYDDDVCAGWGHLASPHGALSQGGPNTLLITGGTGVAENLWVAGQMISKGSYPRASDLGLEAALRAEGWRDPQAAAAALLELANRRRLDHGVERVVLSGRLAELPEVDPAALTVLLGIPVSTCLLPEAPAIGAVVLAGQHEGGPRLSS